LQDTDVAGYLRHAHEQNLISTIEEGRKETQEEFYRVLEERSQRDWEAKKRRVFEELDGRVTGESKAMVEVKKGTHGKTNVLVSRYPMIFTMSNTRGSRQVSLPVLLCRCKAK
jgi:nuclear pore complex protein Nup93